MARLRYLTRSQWIYAVDKLLSPLYAGGPYSRDEMVRLEIDESYHDWLTISANIADLRAAALGVAVGPSISDLPEDLPEVADFGMYADIKGLSPERVECMPLCDLSGLDYCRYLALCGLAALPVPPDVWHWCRIALSESYRARGRDAGDDKALYYLRSLIVRAETLIDGD